MPGEGGLLLVVAGYYATDVVGSKRPRQVQTELGLWTSSSRDQFGLLPPLHDVPGRCRSLTGRAFTH